jgi:hypothetical protein
MSSILANELRTINKRVLKNIVVRWNSIYIMIKSINKITDSEMKTIISKADSKIRDKIKFSKDERKIT